MPVVRLCRKLPAYRVKLASLQYEHSPIARTSAVLSLHFVQSPTGALHAIALTPPDHLRNVPLAPFAGCPALAAWQTHTAAIALVTSRFPSAHLPLLTVMQDVRMLSHSVLPCASLRECLPTTARLWRVAFALIK